MKYLTRAKQIDGPVIIHTITQKGKGYEFAEENPNKYHGVVVQSIIEMEKLM